MAGCAGVLCVLAVADCLLLPSLAAVPPPKSIFGLYGQRAAGHDSIRLSESGNGKVRVALKLYYSQGHTCQLNQDGEWREDHVAIVADGLDANRQCRLNLFFKNGRVLLKDEGLECAPVYCGTRGTLDNVNLPRFRQHRK